jgi:hypothetical protein
LNIGVRRASVGIKEAGIVAALDLFDEPVHATGQLVAQVRPPPVGFERAGERVQSRDTGVVAVHPPVVPC